MRSNYRPSGLRKKGEAIVDAKYAGRKGSRKALYGDDDDEEDSEGEDDDDEMEGEDEEMDDLMAQLEGEGSEDDSEEAFDGQDDEEISEEEEEEDEAPAPAPKKKSISGSGSSKAKEQNEKAMLSQLKQAASADVEKGRDVKKQLVRSGFPRLSLSPARFPPPCALADHRRTSLPSYPRT